MLTRKNQVIVRLNDEELSRLKSKVKKTGLSQAALVRMLIKDYSPKEKPDDRFYIVMRQLVGICNNAHQLTRKANALGFIDVPMLEAAAKEWSKFWVEIRQRYLDPDKQDGDY